MRHSFSRLFLVGGLVATVMLAGHNTATRTPADPGVAAAGTSAASQTTQLTFIHLGENWGENWGTNTVLTASHLGENWGENWGTNTVLTASHLGENWGENWGESL
jgi:hypothetical protein